MNHHHLATNEVLPETRTCSSPATFDSAPGTLQSEKSPPHCRLRRSGPKRKNRPRAPPVSLQEKGDAKRSPTGRFTAKTFSWQGSTRPERIATERVRGLEQTIPTQAAGSTLKRSFRGPKGHHSRGDPKQGLLESGNMTIHEGDLPKMIFTQLKRKATTFQTGAIINFLDTKDRVYR